MGKLYIKEQYSVVPNELVSSPDISLKAKGLFAFLQSKPDGWRFSRDRIVSQLKEGKKAIQAAINELEEHGYLERVLADKIDNKWNGYDYYLYQKGFASKGVRPSRDMMQKGVNISKKESSKKDVVKKNNNIAATSTAGEITEILEAFQMKLNPTIQYGNKTQRKAVDDLLKLMGRERLLKTVAYCAEIRDEQYAPIVTTPYQLRQKMAQVIAYHNRQSMKSPSIFKI